jgi:tetratricopeptide (TPR) repeat protein
MNRNSPQRRTTNKHVTLEQRIRQMARRYRAEQRRIAGRQANGHTPRQTSTVIAGAFVFAAVAAMAASVGISSPFTKANEDYAAGRFADAASGFEQVIAGHGYSAPVLFNLGNAWLQAGQPERAILNYERALVLSPNDAAVRANLRTAQSRAKVEVRKPGILEKVVRVANLNTWAWIVALILPCVCASVVAGRLLRGSLKKCMRIASVAGVCVLIPAGVCIAARWQELGRAVVLGADTPAHIAPAEASGVSFNLRGGEVVRAQESHGSFTLVHTSDDRSGWVSSAAVARVI